MRRKGLPILYRDSSDPGLGVSHSRRDHSLSSIRGCGAPRPCRSALRCQVTEDKQVGRDDVRDQMGSVIDNRREVFLVLTRCTHGGVLTAIKHLRRIRDEERISGVSRGFHLGFRATRRETVGLIPLACMESDVRTLMSMHCRAVGTDSHLADDRQHIQPSAGTMLRFGTSAKP